MKIGIAGIGLLGGSLAAAFRRKLDGAEIWGFSSPETLRKADGTRLFANLLRYEQLLPALAELDALFLCTPVYVVAETIGELAKASPLDRAGRRRLVVSDIGSTKTMILTAAENSLGGRRDMIFVGGHPMAGSEKGGVDNLDPYIFENAAYVLSPSADCAEDELEWLCGLVAATGARPIVLAADVHDQVAALISHLPQLIANSLVDLLNDSPCGEIAKILAGGGFRDLTRVASSPYNIWRDILMSNQTNIAACLDEFIRKLEEVKKLLGGNALEDLFVRSKRLRDEIPKDSRGFMTPIHELLVRVPDQPGSLHRICALMYERGINIKDIAVVKVREHAQGSIMLGFECRDDRQAAAEILRRHSMETFTRD